ncbi:MAG: hypothetical protein ACP5NS_02410 [Candidatus Pacearchaeota archaeon]
MSQDSWQLTFYDSIDDPESIVFCDTESLSFFTRYTLAQMTSKSTRFECPYARVSKRGNLCCDIRGGNRCPTYQELNHSTQPPAHPLTSFRLEGRV